MPKEDFDKLQQILSDTERNMKPGDVYHDNDLDYDFEVLEVQERLVVIKDQGELRTVNRDLLEIQIGEGVLIQTNGT